MRASLGLWGDGGDELEDVPVAAEFAVACRLGVSRDVGPGELVKLSQELATGVPSRYVTSI